jgi:hypothetical protein
MDPGRQTSEPMTSFPVRAPSGFEILMAEGAPA